MAEAGDEGRTTPRRCTMLSRRANTAPHAAVPALLVALLLYFAPRAAAAEYTIAPVVKSTPGGMQVTGAAALAGDGSVVFGGATQLPVDPTVPPFPPPTPRVRNGIYRLRNGTVTPLYETESASEILRIAANPRGDVAFYESRLVNTNNFITQSETIYRIPAAGGAPAVVATDTNGAYETLRIYPARLLLGDDGRVVFPAMLPDTVPPATDWPTLYGLFDGPNP